MTVRRDPKLPGLEETIRRQMRALDGAEVLVGFPGTGAATGEKTADDLVQIAADLEYGTATIPPRPFLRTCLKRNRRRWSNGFEAGVRKADGSARGLAMVLRRVGVVMVGDVQATMRKGPWLPNAPATIQAKGSAQPLIDTGQLIQSVRAVVVIGGRQVEVVG